MNRLTRYRTLVIAGIILVAGTMAAATVHVTRQEFEVVVRDVASLKRANAGLRTRIIALEAQTKALGAERQAKPQMTPPTAEQKDTSLAPVLPFWELHVRALIDGHSALIISPESLRWHHRRYRVPGIANGGKTNYPTYLNGEPWRARWLNKDMKAENWSVATKLQMPLPMPPAMCSIELEPILARGETLCRVVKDRIYIEFNDKAGGAAWYEVRVTLTPKHISAP